MKNIFISDFKRVLNSSFYQRKTEVVARELLGKVFVRAANNKILAAMIVETEAYLPDGDLSCHAAVGKTHRNAPMFESGGILYIYIIYGVHHCINFVTEPQGHGAAVLIRAAEPLLGIEKMIENRKSEKIESLCKGPGNLAKAFGFTREDNFKSLASGEIFVQKYLSVPDSEIITSQRIGISKSKSLPLRFFLKNNKYVSGNKKQNAS